jgi:hypothetical protein
MAVDCPISFVNITWKLRSNKRGRNHLPGMVEVLYFTVRDVSMSVSLYTDNVNSGWVKLTRLSLLECACHSNL